MYRDPDGNVIKNTTYMFVSTEKPGNNRMQNRQVRNSLRELDFDQKDNRVKDIINEIEKEMRKINYL